MKVNKHDLDFILPAVSAKKPKPERCEAEVKDQPEGWRARRGYGNNCQRHAVYNLEGRKLCRLHAGGELLDLLMQDHPTHFYRTANIPALQRKP